MFYINVEFLRKVSLLKKPEAERKRLVLGAPHCSVAHGKRKYWKKCVLVIDDSDYPATG